MVYLVGRHYNGRLNQRTMRVFVDRDDVIKYVAEEICSDYWYRVFSFESPGSKPVDVTKEFETEVHQAVLARKGK